MHRIKYTYSESVEKLKQVAVNTERTFAEIKGLTAYQAAVIFCWVIF